MKNIEDLWVKVTYEVRLGDVEMPQVVYDEFMKANEEGQDIDTMSGIDRYPHCSEWLTENITEKDCMEWKAEVIELTESKTK